MSINEILKIKYLFETLKLKFDFRISQNKNINLKKIKKSRSTLYRYRENFLNDQLFKKHLIVYYSHNSTLSITIFMLSTHSLDIWNYCDGK